MQIFSSGVSCGVFIMSGIRTSTYSEEDRWFRYIMQRVLEFRRSNGVYTFLFSDNFKHKLSGELLAKLILDNKLGELASTGRTRSASTENDIQTWMFKPDMDAIDRFLNRVEVKQKVGTESNSGITTG